MASTYSSIHCVPSQQLNEAWQIVSPPNEPIPRLQRKWKTKNFKAALALCDKIAEIAESEGHHPDLHLTGMNLAVWLWFVA